jgi:hypothetical protein
MKCLSNRECVKDWIESQDLQNAKKIHFSSLLTRLLYLHYLTVNYQLHFLTTYLVFHGYITYHAYCG